MDTVIENLARQYEASQEQGKQLIRKRWPKLLSSTKSALVGSGFYSEQGERLEVNSVIGNAPQDDCEGLEYSLGVLMQCVASKLPQRSEKGAPIPMEAAREEVLSSCEALLYVPAWHDPEFLRLGLSAVVVHQQANALSMIGPRRMASAPLGCIGAVVRIGLLLLIPGALAGGIAAAMKQDVGASALAFYVVGAGVLAGMSAAGLLKEKEDGFAQAHTAWMLFQVNRAIGVAGVGALEQLKRMAADGVKVPSVALDMAEMLRCKMSTCAASEFTKATLEG